MEKVKITTLNYLWYLIECKTLNNNFEDINSYKSKNDSSFLDINKIEKTTDEYEMV